MRYRRLIHQCGFTFPELIIVVGILTTLFALSVSSLSSTQQTTYLDTNVSTFISDLKQQQINAMTGNTEGTGIITDHGIYFGTTSYTLFQGSSYSAGSATNYVVDLESNIEFGTITFPQSQIVFNKGGGEVDGFNPTFNTITLRNSITNEQQTIIINKYGVITNVTD